MDQNMFTSQELAQNFPVISGVLDVIALFLFLVAIWLFARMGDNVNKIRKLLEREIESRRH
jgi:flagellar biogenesis protein FliO